MPRNIVEFITLLFIQYANTISMQKDSSLLGIHEPETEIADYISARGYLPNDKSLPQIPVKKSTNDDVSYILSKLSDEELIKLLNDEPKKNVYDLNDVVRIALTGDAIANKKLTIANKVKHENTDSFEKVIKNYNTENQIPKVIVTPKTAFHKLGNKELIPENQKNKASFLALKKLHNLLRNHARQKLEDENLNDEKKELLFDILVAQLKTLCCKSNFKPPSHLNSPLNTVLEKTSSKIQEKSTSKANQNKEFIFLILNDEIKSNNDDDLIIVNPDTLERNSSVLILGPVTTALTDGQLKIVMDRISNELSKPEYATLLQQLSDGTLSKNSLSVMKNFIYGPETRRYIKAHRCNHQSKLSKIYGGPKWLICTGYLNINTPSLYD